MRQERRIATCKRPFSRLPVLARCTAVAACWQIFWSSVLKVVVNRLTSARAPSGLATKSSISAAITGFFDRKKTSVIVLSASLLGHKYLRETNWVVGGLNGAVARLGLPRTTLLPKMQKLGIVLQKSEHFVAALRCADPSLNAMFPLGRTAPSAPAPHGAAAQQRRSHQLHYGAQEGSQPPSEPDSANKPAGPRHSRPAFWARPSYRKISESRLLDANLSMVDFAFYQ